MRLLLWVAVVTLPACSRSAVDIEHYQHVITAVAAEVSNNRRNDTTWDDDGSAPDVDLVYCPPITRSDLPPPHWYPSAGVESLSPTWDDEQCYILLDDIRTNGLTLRFRDSDVGVVDDNITPETVVDVTLDDIAAQRIRLTALPGVTFLEYTISRWGEDNGPDTLYYVRPTHVTLIEADRTWDNDGTPPDIKVSTKCSDSRVSRNVPIEGTDVTLPFYSVSDTTWGNWDGTCTMRRDELLAGFSLRIDDDDMSEFMGQVHVDFDAVGGGEFSFTFDDPVIHSIRVTVRAERPASG